MVSVQRISYRRIAGYTALVLATLTTLFVMYRLGQVVLLFIFSVMVAAALREPMLRLQRRGISRGVSILLLYLLIIAVLSGALYAIGQMLGEEIRTAGQRFPAMYDNVLRQWQQSPQQWQQIIAGVLPTTDQLLTSIGENGPQVAYQVAGLTYGLANVIISVLAILTLTFYWLVDEDRFIRLWLLLLPVQQRIVARHMWQDIERRVGTFVRSEAIQFIATLLLLWGGLWALDVRYAASWAFYGAIVQLIPWVGIPLTLLPAIPMFWTDPLTITLSAIFLIIVVGTFMDQAVEPWMGVVGIVHPIVSVVALMMLGETAGILGMLVALPLAATIQSLLSQIVLLNTTPRSTTLSIYSQQLQELRARVLRLHEDVPRHAEQRLAVEGMFKRLDELMDKTEHVVQERATAPERRRIATKQELTSRLPAIFTRNRSSRTTAQHDERQN